jgi:hypothetical protein
MKQKLYILILLTLLTACGAGDPTRDPNNNTISKVYLCDANIVAQMAAMPTPYVGGLGEPDSITYTTTGNQRIMIYQFSIARQRITFEYNTSGQCRETVEKL